MLKIKERSLCWRSAPFHADFLNLTSILPRINLRLGYPRQEVTCQFFFGFFLFWEFEIRGWKKKSVAQFTISNEWDDNWNRFLMRNPCHETPFEHTLAGEPSIPGTAHWLNGNRVIPYLPCGGAEGYFNTSCQVPSLFTADRSVRPPVISLTSENLTLVRLCRLQYQS